MGAVLIVNPRASKVSDEVVDRVLAALPSGTEVLRTGAAGDATTLAREREASADAIYVLGGDGTALLKPLLALRPVLERVVHGVEDLKQVAGTYLTIRSRMHVWSVDGCSGGINYQATIPAQICHTRHNQRPALQPPTVNMSNTAY